LKVAASGGGTPSIQAAIADANLGGGGQFRCTLPLVI
jgi:hypothetical protein